MLRVSQRLVTDLVMDVSIESGGSLKLYFPWQLPLLLQRLLLCLLLLLLLLLLLSVRAGEEGRGEEGRRSREIRMRSSRRSIKAAAVTIICGVVVVTERLQSHRALSRVLVVVWRVVLWGDTCNCA